MARVAKRGGKTLDELRGMSMKAKDDFISYYRDGGPWEKAK